MATDIAARGIDVSRISHVINYDMPDTIDAYTHRIGRTGRMEKTGEAFTFVTREEEAMAHSIERVLGAKVERRKLQGFDYERPAPGRVTEFARSQRHREWGNPESFGADTAAPREHPGAGRYAGLAAVVPLPGTPSVQRPAGTGHATTAPVAEPYQGIWP